MNTRKFIAWERETRLMWNKTKTFCRQIHKLCQIHSSNSLILRITSSWNGSQLIPTDAGTRAAFNSGRNAILQWSNFRKCIPHTDFVESVPVLIFGKTFTKQICKNSSYIDHSLFSTIAFHSIASIQEKTSVPVAA